MFDYTKVAICGLAVFGIGFVSEQFVSLEKSGTRIEAVEKELRQSILEHLDDITATQDEILEKLDTVKETTAPNTPFSLPQFKRTFTERYGSFRETPILVWTWKGGNSVKADQLAQTIQAVQERLSVIPKDESMVALLMETSAVESMRGLRVKQMSGGSARGLFQMEPASEADTLNWLRSYFPRVYGEVMFFYNPAESEEWNRCFNVPYQAAMASIYYWRMCGDKMLELVATTESRAHVWKTFYNTHKGKGTVDAYMEKTEQYL